MKKFTIILCSHIKSWKVAPQDDNKIIMTDHHINLLKRIRHKTSDFNQTKTIVKKMKTEVPVLSTMLDYGGKDTIDDLLHVDPEERTNTLGNKFERLLTLSQ